ncbi:TIGR02301 family protein [Aureimonas sp. SA4125]|uniref:TIGR02301 family protein n=1 Tax=Aureimonas sp. SA4125 TaxID=2826993 RepID=UPI001CC38745|nr:TIGR02301 family protein [Aureimonas sp. SA4125]
MMTGRCVMFLALATASLLLQPDAGASERRAEARGAILLLAAAGDETEPAEPAAVRPTGAPYMQPLGRLSSIMGSVHFLRKLCGDDKAEVWRDKMNEILTTLAPNVADRQILIAAFNEGYRSFESTYRNCTTAAGVALTRYQSEGARLSREISARYGN